MILSKHSTIVNNKIVIITILFRIVLGDEINLRDYRF